MCGVFFASFAEMNQKIFKKAFAEKVLMSQIYFFNIACVPFTLFKINIGLTCILLDKFQIFKC